MNRSDIESFFRTLILGDFEENQNTAGQIVGGLISLIPVLDQVLDARDISGTLFRINKQGGFQNATTDQIVNLGFAAFGAIPEVGSAFKTVFKPLWKERRAAKGAVRGGTQAIESLLGMKKGGAVTWIRKELVGKWGARTQEAVSATNMALDASIELLQFIATATGWKDWLIPDSIQELAKDMLPGLKKLRSQIGTYITRASNELREFLEDILGEQAAAIVMAAGQRAAQASVIPGTRPKGGHNAAALKPAGKLPTRQKPNKTGSTPTTKTGKSAGPVNGKVQNTAGKIIDLTNAILGVSGEHIADYICLNKFGWGGKAWTEHDKGAAGKWAKKPTKDIVGKLSRGGSPKTLHALYKLSDGSNGTGLDAVWRAEGHNGGKPYAIVEAKASRDEDAKKFGRIKKSGKQPSIASKLGVSGAIDASDILEPLEDTGTGGSKPKASGKPGGGGKPTASPGAKPKVAAPASPPSSTQSSGSSAPTAGSGKEIVVQMSHEWIRKNIASAVDRTVSNEIRIKKEAVYSRHLFFSPLYHPCAEKHAEAHLKGLPDASHADHDAFHYDETAVKQAVNKRKASLRKKYGNLPSLAAEA
jgi:hypothetical protein